MRSFIAASFLCFLSTLAMASNQISVSPDQRYVIALDTDKKTYASVIFYDRVAGKKDGLIDFANSWPTRASACKAVWSSDGCVAISGPHGTKADGDWIGAFRIVSGKSQIIHIIDEQIRIDSVDEVVDHWDRKHALWSVDRKTHQWYHYCWVGKDKLVMDTKLPHEKKAWQRKGTIGWQQTISHGSSVTSTR